MANDSSDNIYPLNFVKEMKQDLLMRAIDTIRRDGSLVVRALHIGNSHVEAELVFNLLRELANDVDGLMDGETMVEYRIKKDLGLINDA